MLKEKLEKILGTGEIGDMKFSELEALCNEVKELEEENEEVKKLINEVAFEWYNNNGSNFNMANMTSELGDEVEYFIIVYGWSFIEEVTDLLGNSFEYLVECVTGCEDNWGFDDEYTTCSECNELIRTQPDCYAWTPQYCVLECEILCDKCCRDNIETIVEKEYVNNYNNAITMFEIGELEEIGFELLDEEYENGWYGVRDNPSKILENLEDKYREVIFIITNQGQFSTEFQVMVRGAAEEEDDEVIEA